jgi:F-type H+-transporting ATPase subunit b
VVHVAPIYGVLQAEPTAPAAHTEAQPDNPILPTGPELIWGAATFMVLWALMKFVLLKPILATMEERSKKISRDLDLAEGLERDAEQGLKEHEASLATARAEASRIIDDARTEAERRRREILAEAEAEVAGLREQANAEVAQARAEALDSMRSTVATIAVQAAEVVVQKRLDAAGQRAIVDEYLNRASQN